MDLKMTKFPLPKHHTGSASKSTSITTRPAVTETSVSEEYDHKTGSTKTIRKAKTTSSFMTSTVSTSQFMEFGDVDIGAWGARVGGMGRRGAIAGIQMGGEMRQIEPGAMMGVFGFEQDVDNLDDVQMGVFGLHGTGGMGNVEVLMEAPRDRGTVMAIEEVEEDEPDAMIAEKGEMCEPCNVGFETPITVTSALAAPRKYPRIPSIPSKVKATIRPKEITMRLSDPPTACNTNAFDKSAPDTVSHTGPPKFGGFSSLFKGKGKARALPPAEQSILPATESCEDECNVDYGSVPCEPSSTDDDDGYRTCNVDHDQPSAYVPCNVDYAGAPETSPTMTGALKAGSNSKSGGSGGRPVNPSRSKQVVLRAKANPRAKSHPVCDEACHVDLGDCGPCNVDY